ncbi:threonine synthase [bacterium]|nr:threonine synthase [bacterium]
MNQPVQNQEFSSIRLQCVRCQKALPWNTTEYRCACGGLLEVHQLNKGTPASRELFHQRIGSRLPVDQSGVWRFREWIVPVLESQIVTHPEGGTRLYARSDLSAYAGIEDLHFKHEGENPSGSFKDRGMTVAITMAKMLGAKRVACASTGNTSAALAAYAAHAKIQSVVFLPAGKISKGKLSQAVAYGAKCLAVRGDFDTAMNLVNSLAHKLGLYVVNSVNPFRLEGQKTIIWEMLQQLDWKVPDWIVVPAGNLGNTSAFGKALLEAKEWGWIDRLPKIASIQAAGANPFYQSYAKQFASFESVNAETIATAIRIGNPVNFEKGRRAIEATAGVVAQVNDSEILAAKKAIDRAGIGCEPASACTLAGIRNLVSEGIIGKKERVVAILTGNILKDSEAVFLESGKNENSIVEIDAHPDAVERALQ